MKFSNEVADPMLSRKASNEITVDRTANRHTGYVMTATTYLTTYIYYYMTTLVH